MASRKKSSSAGDRPPAEQVARDLYKQQFGTTKADAELPAANAGIDPDAPLGKAETPDTTSKED